MENKKQVGGSSSSMSTMDHLFGHLRACINYLPAESGIRNVKKHLRVLGRDSTHNRGASVKYGNPDFVPQNSKVTESGGVGTREKGPNYENETTEPCYFSSSIYYGGQENYSPRTRSTESPQILKKDEGDDDSNGNNSNSTSRGNWWKGMIVLES
ncbi:hypothetical protein CJ030_MR3G014788 [Morella rubra]|uniref:Uncharacterized protein n=1 Tax=Morella rubra TaxID=262757 RepID=A0A6A1VXV3_9ROSI|nr:hypothetical protein CJ030_MR3G014788 [Morella rubra]